MTIDNQKLAEELSRKIRKARETGGPNPILQTMVAHLKHNRENPDWYDEWESRAIGKPLGGEQEGEEPDEPEPEAEEQKHTPGGHEHDQSSHGRPQGRRLEEDEAEEAADNSIELLRKHGGFTYQPIDGVSPASGFVVSPFPDDSKIVDGSLSDDELEDILTAYIMEHAERFEDPDIHVGGWHDTESGKIFFDLSIVVDTEERVRKIAKTFNQLAYYDLTTGSEVRIEGTTGGLEKTDRHAGATQRQDRRADGSRAGPEDD